jgi:hypothetical protein
MSATVEPEVSLLEDEDFARDAIRPLLGTAASHVTPTVTVHRRRDDGRLVVEYGLDGVASVFAKLYPDHAAGAAAFKVHESLWAQGFGARSPYRVPEPVGYLEEHGVLLLRAAPGEQLARRRLPGSLDDVRRGARWLATLHASAVVVDDSEDAALGMLRLARRAATATACRPELEGVVRRLLETLAERYAPGSGSAELAPTHGRFSAEHVYVSRECVTVVDLDRATLSDPAKDVGELLHRLRWSAGKRGDVPDAIDEAGDAFIGEYLRHSRFTLTALEYQWSFSVVWTLLVLASKHRPGKGWDERSGFLLAELDAIPRRVAPLLEPAGRRRRAG